MEDDNEDNLKNKEDLHIAGRHTALDIFRFAVFLYQKRIQHQFLLFYIIQSICVLLTSCVFYVLCVVYVLCEARKMQGSQSGQDMALII